MKNINKFAKSEMSEPQEKKYVESLYEKHYDEKLKKEYSEKLSSKYNINRNDGGETISKKTGNIRYLLMGAAAIAAIFALVLVFMPMMNSTNDLNTQQFAQSLITIDKIDVKRGKQEDSQLRLELKENYNTKKWPEVLSIYDQLSDLNSEDLYHKGRVLLLQNKYPAAIASFTEISDPDDFKFSAELQYWLAIAYASNEEFDKAKPLLQKVAQSNWMSEEAKTLLEKMK